MRNITIKRNKSFYASLVTLKVYIEDPNNGTMIINGVPCSKVGELKNGEENTFTVGENAAKLYVVADNVRELNTTEYYSLPEGSEDLKLSGKVAGDAANFNPFRFDGVTDEDILASRKYGKLMFIIGVIIALIVGVIAGLWPYIPQILG